jgi:DNA mismatch repair protein MutS2
LQSPENVVSNDLSIGRDFDVAILTGPNAGGKTVALKTYGLFAFMVKLGLGIPAEPQSRVDFFEQIFVEMGDEQDVMAGLSTFASHIKNLNDIVTECDSSSLILLDEIGTGTEPNQGSALAQAILEAMLERKSKIVFTTHYLKLKYLTQVDSRFMIGATSFVNDFPTYKMVWGKMGASFALSLAQKMGMSKDVIQRAKSLMEENELELSKILEELEVKRINLEERNRNVEMMKEELSFQLQQLEKEQNMFYREKETWEREERLQLRSELQQLKTKAKDALKNIKRTPQYSNELREQVGQIEDIEQRNIDELNHTLPSKKTPLDIRVGKSVKHPTLGMGKVIGHRKKDRWLGVFGQMQIEFSVNDLYLDVVEEENKEKLKKKSKKQKKKSKKQNAIPIEPECIEIVEFRHENNTIDLRGMRVDDAFLVLDKQFDEMRLKQQKVVFVLHGHGTGALRKGVREWLPTCSSCIRFQPASQDNGGNAYTMVVIR